MGWDLCWLWVSNIRCRAVPRAIEVAHGTIEAAPMSLNASIRGRPTKHSKERQERAVSPITRVLTPFSPEKLVRRMRQAQGVITWPVAPRTGRVPLLKVREDQGSFSYRLAEK